MPVIINNKRILPAPIVTFGKEFILADDGTHIGSTFTAALQGQILQNKGNPIASTGINFSSSYSTDPWTATQSADDDPLHSVGQSDVLISTITKLEQLRSLVSPPTGVKVEIVGFDHNQGLKFYGNVKQFNVDNEGNWAKPCGYTIDFSFPNFIGPANSGLFGAGSSEDNFSYYVDSVKEGWSIQEDDRVVVDTGNWNNIAKVYNITHSVNAKGKLVYNSSGVQVLKPWQQASGYVQGIIGLGAANLPQSLLTITSGYYVTNRKLNEEIDKYGGTYSVEETFSYVPSGMLPSGQLAFEECSINTERTEGSLTNVTIQGTITGMQSLSPTGVSASGVSRYANASGYYNVVASQLYNRVRQNAGLPWVHPQPKSSSVGRSPNAGQISYAFNYDNRPPNLIPGSISEDIIVNDTYPGQLISATPVIGRKQPILQYLGSRSEYKRSLNININMGTFSPNWNYNQVDSSGLWTGASVTGVRQWFNSKPSLLYTSYFQGIYDAVNPANESGVVQSKVFYDAPQESWSPKQGLYSYSIQFTYERY